MKKLRILPQFKPIKVLLGMIVSFVLILSYMVACSDNDPIEDQPLPDPIADEILDPIADEDLITVDTDGGVFVLPSGIEVTVPQGAVDESKEIKVDNLLIEDAQALNSIITSDDSPFLFGVTISTNEFNFKKPIIVRIPVQKLDENGLPVLYELQGEDNNWLFSDETIIVSNEEKYVEIILKESTEGNSGKSANGSTDAVRIFLSQFYTSVFGIDGSILLPENPCRKLRFSTIVENIDIANSGEGCEGQSVIERFTYLDCDPPISGYFKIAKISPSCEPQITTSAPEELEVGQSGSINMSITLGDDIPLPEQEINLVGEKLLSVDPSSQTTGSGGEAPPFNVQAGDEAGDGLVAGTVALDYYLTFISAYDSESGEVENVFDEFDHVKKDIDVAIAIKVVGLPEVLTTFSRDISKTTAILGGEVTEDWELEDTERGIYLDDEKIPLGNGLGSFSTERQLFVQGTYRVKAYATNQFGTSYGEEKGFVVDIDGNIYPIITIGDQEWITENLKTTRLNDGTLIGYTKIDPDTEMLDYYNQETGTRTWYDNLESNNQIYGTLYSVYAVKTEKLCPTGWRVPTENDFLILTDFAGGYEQAGGKFKAPGTTYWNSPNTGATNEFGLTALPGGKIRRHIHPDPNIYWTDYYDDIGEIGMWWTSTTTSGNNFGDYGYTGEPHKGVGLTFDSSEASFGSQGNWTLHVSCRCVKN